MIACKFCVLTKGLKGSELEKLPRSWKELEMHLWDVHEIAVRHVGETDVDAISRCHRRKFKGAQQPPPAKV